MATLRIGRVVRAIGLQGYLGVAETESALGKLSRIALVRGGREEWKTVLEARPQGRLWAVRVDGISDRTSAEGWVGSEVLAEREDLGDAGEGLHWWGDLEGLAVVTVDGAEIGRVTGLLSTGAVDVLVVVGAQGESLIPLAPYVTVDRDAQRVVVDPPEGLLELGREAPGGGGSRQGPGRAPRSR